MAVQQPPDPRLANISPLQGDAWAAWNASYHEADRDAFKALGEALYRQDVHERIKAHLDRLDEQNELLDRLLQAQREASAR